MNLRRHESPPCSLERVQPLSLTQHGSKSKICQFSSNTLIVLNDEDIIEFNVPMNNRVTMQVRQRLTHLPKDQPSLWNQKHSLFYEVQKISMPGVLLSQQTKITQFPRKSHLLSPTKHRNDVIMGKLAKDTPFVLKMLHLLSTALRHCLDHHLHLLLLQEQDLGVAAFAQQ